MDPITVSEFRRSTKVILDSARHEPVYLRRNDEVFQLSFHGEVEEKVKGVPVQTPAPQKKSGAAPQGFEAMRQEKIEALQPAVNDAYTELTDRATKAWSVYKDKEALGILPRTAADVLREVTALKDQLDREKADNEFNQDPDYWADFNKRYEQIQDLWAEYHTLKGQE